MSTMPHEPSPAPVKTAAEADALIAQVMGVMAELTDVVQQETELVRVGRLGAASAFADPKSDLSRRYVAGNMRLKASKPQLAQVAPDKLAALQKRHEALRGLNGSIGILISEGLIPARIKHIEQLAALLAKL